MCCLYETSSVMVTREPHSRMRQVSLTSQPPFGWCLLMVESCPAAKVNTNPKSKSYRNRNPITGAQSLLLTSCVGANLCNELLDPCTIDQMKKAPQHPEPNAVSNCCPDPNPNPGCESKALKSCWQGKPTPPVKAMSIRAHASVLHPEPRP